MCGRRMSLAWVWACVLVCSGSGEAVWPWPASPRHPSLRPPQHPPWYTPQHPIQHPPQHLPETPVLPRAPAGPHKMIMPLGGSVQPSHHTLPRPPPVTSKPSLLTSFTSLIDPFGIFWRRKVEPSVRRVVERRSEVATSTPTSTTEAPPPLVYFPDGGSGQCEDFAPSGFNTYSFISFLFSVANLVGHVANNVNNNLNNNNNNNNDNNNNINNINSANSNSNVNNENTVTISPGMGRRRRHGQQDDVVAQYREGLRVKEEEWVAALVSVDFLKGLKTALLTSDPACALRNMCEVNRAGVGRGDLGDVLAEVFSLALVESYPRHPPPVDDVTLLEAGAEGRRGADCSWTHPACPDASWLQLASYLDLADGFGVQLSQTTTTRAGDLDLGIPDPRTLMDVTSFSSGLDMLLDHQLHRDM